MAQRAKVLGLLVPLLAVSVASAAWAQGRSAREFIIDQTTVIERYEPPLRRPPTITLDLPDRVAGVPPDVAEGVRFTLTGITVEGARSVPLDRLRPIWRDAVGTSVSLGGIGRIARAIEQAYLDEDIYALVRVPPQDVSADGRVRLIVHESYIREIVVEADDPRLKARLQPYIDRIASRVPIRKSALERDLLLMTELGGLTIRADLSKIPDEPGAGRLRLIIESKKHEMLFRLDNLGTEEAGPVQLGARGFLYDALGLFETTELLAVTTPLSPRELVFLHASQTFPLGTHGLSVGYQIGRRWSPQPGGELSDIDIDVGQLLGGVHVAYPFIRTLERNLIGRFAFRTRDDSIDLFGQPFVRDHQRWVEASAIYDDTIAGVSVLGEVTAAHGIAGLGSTGASDPLAGRPGGRPDFQLLSFQAELSRPLGDDASITLQVAGQKSFVPLPSAVRFDIGGETFGRGFDNQVVSGDDGLVAVLELAHRIDTAIGWLPSLEVYGFADYGKVWNDGDLSDYASASLGSVGVGFRSRIGDHGQLGAYVAVPYKTESSLGADEGARVLFVAGLRF